MAVLGDSDKNSHVPGSTKIISEVGLSVGLSALGDTRTLGRALSRLERMGRVSQEPRSPLHCPAHACRWDIGVETPSLPRSPGLAAGLPPGPRG